MNALVFFGVYCLLLGYLVFKSAFLPHGLGILLVVGGLGWLTFVSRPLAAALIPYNMATGILAETILTLWLLFPGLHARRWNEQAAVNAAALGRYFQVRPDVRLLSQPYPRPSSAAAATATYSCSPVSASLVSAVWRRPMPTQRFQPRTR